MTRLGHDDDAPPGDWQGLRPTVVAVTPAYALRAYGG